MTALEAIKQIIEERSRDGIVPLSAPFHLARLLSELPTDEFAKQIQELEKLGAIRYQLGINSYNLVIEDKYGM